MQQANDEMPAADAGPVDLVLGPLPEADVMCEDGADQWGYATYSHAYSAEAMQAYAAEQVAAERERWKAPTLILWPLTHRVTKDLVFTAERAGEVQAAIQQLRQLLKA